MNLDLWAATLAALPVDEVYVCGALHPDLAVLKPFKGAKVVPDASQIPGELVVLSPKSGERFPGVIDLDNFSHPKDVVYFFGADNEHLEASILGRAPDAVVCIPVPGFDHLYGHVAGAIVLHDRLICG